jgi:hypothetical protein
VWEQEFTSTIFPDILAMSSARYSGPDVEDSKTFCEGSSNTGQLKRRYTLVLRRAAESAMGRIPSGSERYVSYTAQHL